MKATEKPFHVGLFILLSKSCSTVVVNLVLFSNVFRLVVVDFSRDFYLLTLHASIYKPWLAAMRGSNTVKA